MLIPIERVLPDVPQRQRTRWCRENRIAGAVKIGRRWFVREGTDSSPNEDTAARLRALGYAA